MVARVWGRKDEESGLRVSRFKVEVMKTVWGEVDGVIAQCCERLNDTEVSL